MRWYRCLGDGAREGAVFPFPTLPPSHVSYGSEDRVHIVLTNPPFGGKEEAGIESDFPSRLQTRKTADLFSRSSFAS